MVKIQKLSEISAKFRKTWNASFNDQNDDAGDDRCNPKEDFSDLGPVRSTLFVEICGNRFFLSRKIAARRYCQLKNDELIVAKSQDALASKGALHWDVRKAAAFDVYHSGNRNGVVKKKNQGKWPFTIEITDKSGRKIRLYFANQKEMAYWLLPLKRAYLKKCDMDDEAVITTTTFFDQDEFQSDDAVAADDAENFQSFEEPCSSGADEDLKLTHEFESEISTNKVCDANQAYERKLQRLGEMLLEKRDVLRKRLGLDLTDDVGQMAHAKTRFAPFESPIFPVKDAMLSVDDGFHNEQISCKEYGKLENVAVIDSFSTESGIVFTPGEEQLPALGEFSNVEENVKENLTDYPVNTGSPIFKFVAPLYPIPFTKVAEKSSSDYKFSLSTVGDSASEQKDEILRSMNFPAASNHLVTEKDQIDTKSNFLRHANPIVDSEADGTAFYQSPSFLAEDRGTLRIKFLTSTVANDKTRKIVPPPSFSFDETSIDHHPCRKSTVIRTTKVQTNFGRSVITTTSDQMTACLVRNQNFTTPPYKTTVKISRAAQPQRVDFATVGLTIKTSNSNVVEQRSFSSAKVTMRVSPVSYVYTPFNITCKLCRRNT